jgi:hypothetical protein
MNNYDSIHSDTTAGTALEARLGRLERENRRLKRAGFLVLCAIAVPLVVGFARQGKTPLTASQFELTDDAGKVRASLFLDQNTSQPWLTLYDDKGTARTGFGLQKDGRPEMLMWNASSDCTLVASVDSADGPVIQLMKDKATVAELSVNGQTGSPALKLNGPGATAGATLSVDHDSGTPALTLADPHLGKGELDLDLDKGGLPSLSLLDPSGIARGTWWLANPSGTSAVLPQIRMMDDKGKVRIALEQSSPDGSPRLAMAASDGKAGLRATVKDTGPHLGMSDAKGRGRFSAP